MESVDLERYGVGRLCDARLEARAALLHEALVANPGCRVRRIAGGVRRKEMGFTRFLRNPRVSPRALSQAMAGRVADRVEGRDVLAIQDTSQIVLGNREKARQGYGPVGKGGNLRGVLMHPVLAVDAASGDLLGLVDVEIWNRHGRKRVTKARTRPKAEENPGVGARGRFGRARFWPRRAASRRYRIGKATTSTISRIVPKTWIFSRASSTTGKSRPANRGRIQYYLGMSRVCRRLRVSRSMFPPLRAGRRAKRNWRYGSPL